MGDNEKHIPVGSRTSQLMSKVGQYHGTMSIDLIITCYWCQIANSIWTSTHEVNMMSRMCLEDDHWQKHLVKTNFCWKLILAENLFMSMWNINLMATVDANLMLTVDATKTVIFLPMVNGQLTSAVDNFLWEMGAPCLVLIIYLYLSIRAIVEVKHVLEFK